MTSVAIIGRVNVGKSTLFNKLVGKRQAMVSNTAGTTRDLKYAQIEWQHKNFEIIDTGGFLSQEKKPLKILTKKEVQKRKKTSAENIDFQVEQQARMAVKKSAIIIFVVDAKQGLNPQDKQIAAYLRQIKNPPENKKVILTANKCDRPETRLETAEFNCLGLGEPMPISAANGSGTGDLLDQIIKHISSSAPASIAHDLSLSIRVSIIGKPNVGKSSLLNSLINQNRAIVSSIPHTTREPNSATILFKQHEIILTDTAGIRRKSKIAAKTMEKTGVAMTISCLKNSNLALFIIDLSEPISKQDLRLAKLIVDYNINVIIIANKYDLVKKNQTINTDEITANIYHIFPHLNFAPIIFTSAKTGLNTQKILQLIIDITLESSHKIAPSALSRFIKSIIKHQPPPKKRIGFGRKTKIKRSFISNFKQIDTNPPTFQLQLDTKEKLPENYRQYIINSLRSKFGFKGSVIKLVIRPPKQLNTAGKTNLKNV